MISSILSFLDDITPSEPKEPSKPKYTYYFAYGSNMKRERLEERIGKVVFIGKAVLESYELDFSKRGKDGSGKANVTYKIDKWVEGAIFKLTTAQLSKLDKFEGRPLHYQRVKMEVKRVKDDKVFIPHLYVAQKAYIELNLVPLPEYLKFIIEGAAQIKALETHDRLLKYLDIPPKL